MIVNVCCINSIEEAISEADFYITNHQIDTITKIELANKYGVKVISGVDRPLF